MFEAYPVESWSLESFSDSHGFKFVLRRECKRCMDSSGDLKLIRISLGCYHVSSMCAEDLLELQCGSGTFKRFCVVTKCNFKVENLFQFESGD